MEQAITKPICHYCKRFINSEALVPCKILRCGLFFCHACLTSKYKYSKSKAESLPTEHWKCPVCGNRCKCDFCKHDITKIPIKKGITKRHKAVQYYYRKKDMKIIRKHYSYIDFNAKASPSKGITQSSCSPDLNVSLPPITGIILHDI